MLLKSFIFPQKFLFAGNKSSLLPCILIPVVVYSYEKSYLLQGLKRERLCENNLIKWASMTHTAFLGGNVFMLTFYFPFHSVQVYEYLWDAIQFNPKFHLLDCLQISNLTPVCFNFPNSKHSTTRFQCLSSCHEYRDRPLTWRRRANYSMCASNCKAAMELSNLSFSECSLSKLRGKNATQYWWEEKMAFFCVLEFRQDQNCPLAIQLTVKYQLKKISLNCMSWSTASLWETWSRCIMACLKTVRSLGELKSNSEE